MKDKILLLNGEPALGSRVKAKLKCRGIDALAVEPTRDNMTPEDVFDVAFENRVTAVVFLEPLARYSGAPSAPLTAGVYAAALRAVQAPMVTGFGWVTSRDGDDAVSECRRRGTPYGVLRVDSLLDIEVDADLKRTAGKPVLVDTRAAFDAQDAKAMPLDCAAEAIAVWIEREGLRKGGDEAVEAPDTPLERAVEELGFQPTVLASWRVKLNAVFGAVVVEGDGDGMRVKRRSVVRRGARSERLPVEARPMQSSS